MKIVLCGVQTINKGAELMLYAIIQEIERKFPKAIIYLPDHLICQPVSYICSSMDIRKKPIVTIRQLLHRRELFWIVNKIRNLCIHCRMYDVSEYFNIDSVHYEDVYSISNADYFFDASGFHFSDQFDLPERRIRRWELILKRQSRQGTKMFFLPQAFGPVEKESTKRALLCVNRYSTLIMPREETSLAYLESAGMDMDKVKKFPDFTSIVKGEFPVKYNHLKDGICVIPNKQMIRKGKMSLDGYISLLSSIIQCAKKTEKPVYLLNHEGLEDEELALLCKEKIGDGIEVVTGLNALEVKGMISSSYLCISSRFHGVASALSTCVPCLATSWSHKYLLLYSDYGLKDGVLPLDNTLRCLDLVMKYLNSEFNAQIRKYLSKQLPHVQKQTRDMWKLIWSM